MKVQVFLFSGVYLNLLLLGANMNEKKGKKKKEKKRGAVSGVGVQKMGVVRLVSRWDGKGRGMGEIKN